MIQTEGPYSVPFEGVSGVVYKGHKVTGFSLEYRKELVTQLYLCDRSLYPKRDLVSS